MVKIFLRISEPGFPDWKYRNAKNFVLGINDRDFPKESARKIAKPILQYAKRLSRRESTR